MISFMISLAQPLTDYGTKKYASISTAKSIVKGASFTHSFCIFQALNILYNDDFTKVADIFKYFLKELNDGVVWADKGFKSIHHYYNPDTGYGKCHLTSAAQLCADYTSKAIKLWKNKKHHQAMFYLGAAAHLIQDMCVPHHACCVAMDGHHYFEKWAEDHREEYLVEHAGMYMGENQGTGLEERGTRKERQKTLNLASRTSNLVLCTSEEAWFAAESIHLNAVYSKKYFTKVQSGSSEEDFHDATAVLLPRAQRSTSGFWKHFYNLVIE